VATLTTPGIGSDLWTLDAYRSKPGATGPRVRGSTRLAVTGVDGVGWRALAWRNEDGGGCMDVRQAGEKERTLAVTCHGTPALAQRIRRRPQVYAGGSGGGEESTQAVFGFVRAGVLSLTVIGLDERRWEAALSRPFASVGTRGRRVKARAFLAAVPGPRPRSGRDYELETETEAATGSRPKRPLLARPVLPGARGGWSSASGT